MWPKQKAKWNLPFKGNSQNSQIAKIQANTCKFMPTFALRSGVPSSVSSETYRKYAKEKRPCNLPTVVGPSPVSSEPKTSNLTKNWPQNILGSQSSLGTLNHCFCKKFSVKGSFTPHNFFEACMFRAVTS